MSQELNNKEYQCSWNAIKEQIKDTKFDIILHNTCPDGIGAAWVYKNYKVGKGPLPDDVVVKGVSDGFNMSDLKDIDVKGKNILIVDTWIKRKDIPMVIKEALSIFVVDHHIDSHRVYGFEVKPDMVIMAKKLSQNPKTPIECSFDDTGDTECECINCCRKFKLPEQFKYIYDPNYSTAQIMWNILFNTTTPWFINIIADRDLWLWNTSRLSDPSSFAIGKYLCHKKWYNMADMDMLNEMSLLDIGKYAIYGTLIADMEQKDIDALIKKAVLTQIDIPDIGNKRVYLCVVDNTSLNNELGAKLAQKNECDFAAIARYDYSSNQWWISLRSIATKAKNMDVIANKFAGGGQPLVSGFSIQMPGQQLKDFFKPL